MREIIGKFLRLYIYPYISYGQFVLFILFALFQVFLEVTDDIETFWAYVIFGVIAAIYIVLFILQERRRSLLKDCEAELFTVENYADKLNEEIVQLENIINKNNRNLEKSLELFTKSIYESLELNDEDRITLFREHKGKLSILSRYSDDQIFKAITNRAYEMDEGFVGIAWRKGKCSVEIDYAYSVNEEGYINDSLQKCEGSFSEDKIHSLTMKSQSYFLKAIRNRDETRPIGMFVCESLTPNKMMELDKKLTQVIEKNTGLIRYYFDNFIVLLESSPEKAKQYGL